MNLDDIEAYDYELPDELIAAHPTARRGGSRLMVLRTREERLEHGGFDALMGELGEGDLLVFNDAQVVPGRVFTNKRGTGGKVELLVLGVHDVDGAPVSWTEEVEELRFTAMCKANKPPRPGQVLEIAGSDDTLEVLDWEAGHATLRSSAVETTPLSWLERHGELPLPPYIVKRRDELGEDTRSDEDATRYQTVLASKPGAVAAPTAGLHFDEEMLAELERRGVRRATVTLYVGPGTFQPVRSSTLSGHEMHTERYEIGEELVAELRRVKATGGRVVAVGTTSMRALEAEARRDDPFVPGERATDIFLKPGSGPRLCDCLLTNFHLPRSTLLALVASMAGHGFMMKAYEVAVERGYRFYSYGDAMFIEGRRGEVKR